MHEQNTRRQFLRTASLLGVGLAAASDRAHAAASPTALSDQVMMPSRGIAPWPPAQVAGSGDIVEVSSGLAIQNAAVVNTRDGTVAQGMTIVVDAGRIQKIGPTASIRLGGAAQAVDASGKYV